ncbi:MAG: hypothetical protein HYY58_02710, partial [Candidatus Omnitrophica bacterium]|nr:hypothetical protein [Candidatus Omnitrophota bacterium]
DTQIAGMQTGVTQIQSAGGSLIITAEKATADTKRFAAKLVMSENVLMGQENVPILYLADEGITPLPKLNVMTLDKEGKVKYVVKEADMEPTDEDKSVYKYVIKKITAEGFIAGQGVRVEVTADVFTFVEDPDKAGEKVQNKAIGTFMVQGTTLDALAGSISSLSNVPNTVKSALVAIQALQSAFGSGAGNTMIDMLNQMSSTVDKLPADMKRAVLNANQGNAAEIKRQINDVSDHIKSLAGDNLGMDFTQIMGKALEENASLRDVRKKTDAVQGATEVMQIIMERKLGGIDAPVVHAVYK